MTSTLTTRKSTATSSRPRCRRSWDVREGRDASQPDWRRGGGRRASGRLERAMSGAETEVRPRPLPLSAEQRAWVEAAWAQINPDRLARLDADLTSIPTPTGEEREGAEFLVRYLAAAGLDARYQPIDERQGNATARLRGTRAGPD